MQQFESGDVYFCTFPKFVQIPNTNDYHIDSMKPNVAPRPVAVLYGNTNRIIVAPISSDQIQNNLKYDTFVPLRATDYPSFLKNDSFMKTNQIQVIDSKWLYPTLAPIKVGQLNTRDLDRVRYFSLYATQSEKSYSQWVSEIVSKNIKKVSSLEIQKEVNQLLDLPERHNKHRVVLDYERGDIFEYNYQPAIHNQSPERISGTHKTLILTDAKSTHIPAGQAIGIPLLSNQTHSHFHSNADVGVMLDGNIYRACVSQIQPLNRDWLVSKVGKVPIHQQLDVDRAVIDGLGMKQDVIEQSRKLIQKFQQRNLGR